MKEIYL